MRGRLPAVPDEVALSEPDTHHLASNLTATSLFVASGGGDAENPQGIAPNPDDLGSPVGVISGPVKETCFLMSRAFVAALDAAGIPHRDDFYGSGTHEMKYWRSALRQYLPQMAAAWADPRPAPRSFSYRSIQPRFSVWGWSFESRRDVTEFTYLEAVGSSGLTAVGSGQLDVVTARLYEPGGEYRVAQGAPKRVVTADGAGRLSFRIDLGPAHSSQQQAFDDASLRAWTRAVITIAPVATA